MRCSRSAFFMVLSFWKDSIPEIGFKEFKTAEYIEEQLRKLPGVQVVTKLGGTGMIGMLVARRVITNHILTI